MNWTQTNETNECVYFTCGNRRKKKCNSTRIIYKNPYNVIETSHSTSCRYEQNKQKFAKKFDHSTKFDDKIQINNETHETENKLFISLNKTIFDEICKKNQTTLSSNNFLNKNSKIKFINFKFN